MAIKLKILALRWQVVCTVASMVPTEPSTMALVGLCPSASGKKASLAGSTVKAVKGWGSSWSFQGVDWIILGRMQIHTYMLIYIGNDLDV
jgi:hypothetical protein